MKHFPNAMSYPHGFQIRHFFKKGEYYRIAIWKNNTNLTEFFAKELDLPLVSGQIDIKDNYELLNKIMTHMSDLKLIEQKALNLVDWLKNKH